MRPLPRYRETRPWRGRSSTVSALVVVTGYMTSSPFSWAAAHPFLPSPRGHPKTWAWVVFRDARSKSRNPHKWITSFIFHRTTILLPFCIKISKGGKTWMQLRPLLPVPQRLLRVTVEVALVPRPAPLFCFSWLSGLALFSPIYGMSLYWFLSGTTLVSDRFLGERTEVLTMA